MRKMPFHLVDASPWPFFMSLSLFSFITNLVMMMNLKYFNFFFSVLIMITIMFLWFRDITRESTYLGFHSSEVQNNILLGMIWFILSEIFFFLGIFWSFLHSSLSSSVDYFLNWPPTGIIVVNPLGVPLLNTALLLSSGFSVTWSHYSILNSSFNESFLGLVITILLGVLFTLIQYLEYLNSFFSISSSCYGSCFFLGTGFHGMHVIIGTSLLMGCLFRFFLGHFNMNNHIGFECSIWYWHFVDVVWIFLFLVIYCWGSM
uniref:Cytochrome c oxidase subunit 3 n=1 Tax=Lissoclinum sp. TIC-2013-079 TaxID=2010181 RepID=A0A2D1BZQ2_9ASCI|nr:cytochrome c oxidase subunit III [Lissoclinum sp. TIC-2013-079]